MGCGFGEGMLVAPPTPKELSSRQRINKSRAGAKAAISSEIEKRAGSVVA
jgi:hypothetical protein